MSSRAVPGATTSTRSQRNGATPAQVDGPAAAVVADADRPREVLGEQVVDRDAVLRAGQEDDEPEDDEGGAPAARRPRPAPGSWPTYHPRLRPMSPVHEPLPPNVSFPALEEQVLARWRERDVFRESLRRREGAPPFVFYEGPPTANGRPGSHHVLARVFKDVFPRYKTMTGHYVERKARLGHARPAGRDRGRAEARLQLQGRHRALRHRGVQRQVPRVGVRVPRGLDAR